jgi:hypothetical protein
MLGNIPHHFIQEMLPVANACSDVPGMNEVERALRITISLLPNKESIVDLNTSLKIQSCVTSST